MNGILVESFFRLLSFFVVGGEETTFFGVGYAVPFGTLDTMVIVFKGVV